MTVDPETRLDNAIMTFLRSIPQERQEELRMMVREARERRQAGNDRSAVVSEERDAFDELRARRPPLPVPTPEQRRQTSDHDMLSLMRAAGRAGDHATEWREPGLHQHLVALSAVTATPLRWLSPGRLAAGKITVLDGDPGLGKSTLLCELAARISQGEALPGGEPAPPRGVLLLSAEDDLHDTIRPRIDAAGGDPRRIMSLLAVPDGTASGRPFTIPGDGPILEMLVRKIDAALVIIDPLVAYLHGGLSANNDQDVRRALAALQEVGARTGAAIVVVRHLNKSAGNNPLYRGGGSIGIIGAARCGLLLAEDPAQPARRILAATKGNLGHPPASLAFRLEEAPQHGVARLVWEGATRWSAAALLRAVEHGDDHSVLGEARAWLREALANGPRPATEMQSEAQARGFTRATILRAKRAEAVVARKSRAGGGGWTWSLAREDNEGTHQTGLENVESLESLHLPTLDQPGSPSPADAAPLPHQQCVDCGGPLLQGQTTRCSPCLAKALTA